MEELDVEGGPARGVPHKDIDDRGQAVPEAFIAASADHAGYLVNLDVGELEAADVDLKEVVEELLGGADEDAHDVGAISRQTKIKVSVLINEKGLCAEDEHQGEHDQLHHLPG